jgi:hypothetical protein
MYCPAAVSLLIAGILANTVMHACGLIAPGTESSIDRVGIRIDQRSRTDGGLYQRFDGRLLDGFKPRDDAQPTTLNHPEARWLLFRKGAAATCPSPTIPTPVSSLRRPGYRIALVACHTVDLVARSLSRYRYVRLVFMMPSRHSVVIWCTSL